MDDFVQQLIELNCSPYRNNHAKSAVPILASLNADETIAFYTQKLGFTFHSNWEGYLIFSRDEIQIHLWSTSDEDAPKNTGCYVNVTNVDQLYEAFLPLGIVHPDG